MLGVTWWNIGMIFPPSSPFGGVQYIGMQKVMVRPVVVFVIVSRFV